MKKILAMVLAMMLVLSMSTAFADEGTTTKVAASKPTTYEEVIKAFDIIGETDTTLFPDETLNFTSAAATTNPDGGVANISIDPLPVTSNGEHKLVINVPSFTKVGTYHFTISETPGKTQGATYTTAKIAVSVLVTYDYADEDGDGYTMTAQVGITSGDSGKNDTLTNTYKVGKLNVTKTVTGNLGDTSKEFVVNVTFNSTGTVASDITYTDSGVEKKITIADMEDKTHTVQITLIHGESVLFTDIPDGVTYSIEEEDYTGGEKNGENGYDDPVYSNQTGTIAADSTINAGVTNNKETSVDTGIVLDNAPYMILMALVVVAGAALIVKRASANR